MRAIAMQPPRGHVERNHAAAGAVLHDEIQREVLDVELGVVLDGLLIQRVQHGVAGAVRGRAGAMRRAFAVVRGHAAEGSLVDAAVVGARERHAIVLELDDRGGRFLAHELDGVLVTQPVRTLDGVVEVKAPVVLAHVAKRGGDAALRGHCVAAGRKYLGDAGSGQAGFGQSQRGAQPGAARSHDHDVVGMVDEFVFFWLHERASTRMANTAGDGGAHVHEGGQQQQGRLRDPCRGRSLRRPPARRASNARPACRTSSIVNTATQGCA